jgi:histidyl-tRNA synthetase
MELEIDLQARGTRIITGEEAKLRRHLLNKLIGIAESYGFEEIQLPTIEPATIYTYKAGPEILNSMYVFQDKKSRQLCLRPEATATVQLIGERYYPKNEKKYWYFERCYRYERPQAGRYREFYQFGVEVLNPKDKLVKEFLIDVSREMVETKTKNYLISHSVKRGLDYYIEDGFEIACPELGAQKQVVGGGRYSNGIGFAVGFDRLALCKSTNIYV